MRILALDIGSWSIKAVEMESRFRRLDVLDFHEVRFPLNSEPSTEVIKKAIEQLLAKLPSHPEKIVAALAPANVALRVLSFPIKQRKKVEQMFRFELEDNVPFKLDNAIVEHHFFKRKDGSLVFAGIAPKVHIKKQLDWLTSIGVEADWLAFDGLGVINIALMVDETSEAEATQSGPELLLDIGHSKTNLIVLDQGAVQYYRNISWGGKNVTSSLSLNLGVSLPEAQEIKHSKLNLEDKDSDENEIYSSATQALASFFTDLNHSLAAYRNTFKQEVTKIRLLGGTSLIRGLAPYIEAQTGISTERIKPVDFLDLKDELKNHEQARFAEAWGRGMALGRKAPILFNFRKEDLARQTSLTEAKEFLANPNIVKLSTYLGMIAFILFVHVNIASFLAEKDLNSANEELKKVFQDTFRSVPQKQRAGLLSNPEQLKKFIEQKNKELEQKLLMLSKGKTPVIGLIRQVSSAFPKTVKVDVNTLLIDDRRLNIEGVLYEGDLNAVVEAIKKLPSFNEVALSMAEQRFTITGKTIGR